MIFWILLFILVVVVSFLLAYLSMRNFQEAPTSQNGDYGLFLIRKTLNVTPLLLADFHQQMVKGNFIISFERLFKGHQSTLVMFAPRKLIQNYVSTLDLVELEDYTNVDSQKVLVHQMGTKQKGQMGNLNNFFEEFPMLNVDEFIWWQLIFHAKQDGTFEILPRAAFFTKDKVRLFELGKSFQNLAGFLHKLPKPYTLEQMLKFYKNRSFAKGPHNLNLPAGGVLDLILLKNT